MYVHMHMHIHILYTIYCSCFFSCAFRPKWISVHGTMYKVGCVLWITNDEEETPQFSTPIDICVIETDLKSMMLVAEALTTVTFNKHLNAYEVVNTADLIFVQQDELLYPLPLHIITATNQEHVKLLYVQSIMFPIFKS